MRTLILAALTLPMTTVSLTAQSSATPPSPAPPVARVQPKVDTLNGEVRVDNYFWLREKQNPEVMAYLEAENAYTAAGMRHTEALQERIYPLYVKDLATGQITDAIPNVWNGTAWADDNRTFFYMTADSAKRGNAVWRHVLGTPRAADVKVFQEDNVLNNVTVFRSRSGRVVFIPADGFTSSEWRVIPTADPTADPPVIAPRPAGVEYEVDHGDGFFFLYTNDNARNFKIVRIPETDFSPAGWTDWLPHRDSVFVEGVDVFRRFAVVSERSGGLRRLRVTNLQTKQSQYVTFPEAAYGVFPANNPEFDTETYRFSYSSLVTPNSVYDYDLRRGTRELKKRQEIPSGFDASRYEVRRLMARARDGVQVPASVLLRRRTRTD